MYRTGDLARWLPTGDLEYLGRVDTQVKIRGFRVEPGEIEAVLRRDPGVDQVAVVAREDQPGVKRLVAYVVPAGSGVPVPDALRELVRRSLPEHMVPAAFVALDRLPLTRSGKLDHRALPAPERDSATETPFVAPRTATERAVADVWARVLGVERVGALDDFFALGGDSILSIRVVSGLREALGLQVSPRALFTARTVAALAAQLSGDAAGTGTDAARSPIPVLPRTADLPLSSAQQRLWFLNDFDPDSVEYVSPAALLLRGMLDVDALVASLTGLVGRHEALRTTFEERDGQGVQVVHPPHEVEVPVLDLTGLPEEEREARLRAALADEVRHPFDLRRGPLLRVRLVRMAPDAHVLVLTMHHIVTDGWSTGVVTEELGALYAASLRGDRGDRADLRALPVQYADFAAWQRGRLSDVELAGHLDYWRGKLAGVPVLELPTDRPRPPVRGHRAEVLDFALPPELTARVVRLGRRAGNTLFTTLVAACQLLLHRWSGQDDVAVGTVASGRDRPELEGLVGFFVNTLVLRSTVDGRSTFADFLGEVGGTVLDAFAHQDVPFERLVDELGVARDTSRTPLFQVMVVLQNAPSQELDLPGLTAEPVDLPVAASSFDLMLEFQESGDTLHGALTYDPALFDRSTMERLVAHLHVLLDGVSADPELRLAEAPLLTRAEAHRVLVEWNDTDRAAPSGSVPERFAAQAHRTPDAPAVVLGDTVLTYRELDTRSDRLARRLVALGAGPEDRVGLLMERSIELVVATLAILKAGGAYAPLDARAPAERLRLVLAEAAAKLLLTDRRWAPVAESMPATHVLVTDEPADRPDGPEGELAGVDPNALAYVMYTSGSTGTPKGVAVRHRDVVDLVLDRRFDTDAHRTVLMHSPQAFDASTYELWVPLLRGGRIVVAPPGDVDASVLRRAIAGHGVRAVWLTAGLFRLLVSEAPECLAGAAEVWTGGDVVPAAVVRRALASCPGLTIVDGYGPTETTTFALSHPIPSGQPVPEPIPIGRPLDNMRAYILDAALGPVPVGVAGELYLAGAGLARGYLDRPGLTAQRFVADPYGGAGRRMYRTGDLARWRADGTVEFLGRGDDQVKLRGFRIELGEVEAALRAHDGVAECVVAARADGDSPKRLVAYLVPQVDAAPPDPADLRAALAGTLPEYMVPAAYVTLAQLPVTANGKVDRRELPAPDPRPARQVGYAAPQGPVQEALAAVWADVLGLERVGVRDNFFELGGDSILSIQVASRARQAGLHLTTRELFAHQTIEALAEVVSQTGTAGEDGRALAGPVPLTPIQQWFFQTHPHGPHHFNQSILTELAEDVDVDALRQALDAVVAHHDALRLRYERVDGQWRQQQPVPGEGPVLHRHDLSTVDDEELFARMEPIADAVHAGFDLSRGPLLCGVLFDRGADRRPYLLLVAHHLVVDGVSWRILLDDLDSAYRQAADRRTVHLGQATTAFAEWARRLSAFASEGGLDGELEYWEAATDTGPLPTDRSSAPAPATASQAVAGPSAVSVEIGAAETVALLRSAPTAYRTRIGDVLLAALAVALSRWTGRDRVEIALEGHGREDVLDGVDLSRTVGWFTTIYPVAVRVPSEPDWRALVRSVRRQLRAVPGNGFGYGVLRYLGRPEVRRRLAGSPGPQIVFNYLGQWEAQQAAGSDGLYRAVHSSLGQEYHPGDRGEHLLEVVGAVDDGQLQFTWYYHTDVHDEATVARVAADFADALRAIARDAAASTAPEGSA